MVRDATLADLPRVNELRRQVNAVHVAGRPDVFREGFAEELQVHAADFVGQPDKALLVCERDGALCGFASAEVVRRPQSPYNRERAYYHVEEFGVDEAHRREGVGAELVEAVRARAKAAGMTRVELDMWEFNAGALRFYEKMGFTTYRRYMETGVE